MKKIKLYSLLFIGLALLSSCKDEVEAPGTAYAAFQTSIGDITVTPGQDYAQSISIYAANITGSDRTIDLMTSGTLSAASYVMASTVTIPANSNEGVIDIVFKDVDLDIIVDKTLSIDMTASSDLYVGKGVTLNVAKGCPAGEGKLKIAVSLDSYPEEVYWRIVNLDLGAVVMANNATPGYGGYQGLSGTQRDANCLVAGNYRFDVFDAYADGGGAIEITVNGVQVFASNGAYGGGLSSTFTIN